MTQRTYHARLQKHRRHRKVCKNTNQRLQFTNIHLCTIIIHNTYPIIFPFRIFGAAPPGVALSKWTRLLSDAAKRCRWQTVGSILDGLYARARRLRIGTVLFVFLVVNATTSMFFFCGIIMVVHGFSESSRNGVSNSFNYLRRFMNGFTRDSMR